MAPASFGQLMNTLTDLGFFEGLLPFVVTYTVFFFLLRYLADEVIFDEWDNNKPDQFAAILSIAFAFFTARFVMQNPVYADFFTQYLGRVTVLVVGLLGLLVMIGFVGIDLESNNAVGWTLALIIVAAFAVSGGLPASVLPAESQSEIIATVVGAFNWSIDTGVIFIALIGGLLYWTMRPEDSDSDRFQWFGPWAAEGDDEG